MSRATRIKALEFKHKQTTEKCITNVYHFIPSKKEVYRAVRQYEDTQRVYMNYDEVMSADYVSTSTILWLPDYDEEKNPILNSGQFEVMVHGPTVINENNL